MMDMLVRVKAVLPDAFDTELMCRNGAEVIFILRKTARPRGRPKK
jgi:hypothetical protein